MNPIHVVYIQIKEETIHLKQVQFCDTLSILGVADTGIILHL